ncbi:uncharacterized protein LOC135698796 [Ochlerotatus camptorhynchus]|uniref:uncharacterized protein LOC135698796 n=1 Tax=Ochlerotatus camptorhynchus TaxID=644619 RepID=UPI0031D47FD9
MDDSKIFVDSSDDEFDELVFAQQVMVHALSTAAAESGEKHRGSRPGKRPNINRFAEEGARRLFDDYFAEEPVYTSEQFRRRFRMRRYLFLRIAKALERNEYFIQKPDATDIYSGKAPPVKYVINGHIYNTGYYLADGIYPPLSTLVQTIPSPVGNKRKHFAEMQESARKDIERTFGVLTSRFEIIKNPARLWNKEELGSIMRTCIILHNMIIEDQRDCSTPFDGDTSANTNPVLSTGEVVFGAFLARFEKVHDTFLHNQLQNDLTEHLWKLKGDEQ